MKRWIGIVLALVMAIGLSGCTNEEQPSGIQRVADKRNLTPEQYTVLNTVGTDALGRTFGEADNDRGGRRYVGIWYSLWLGQHTYMQTSIYDNEKLLSTPEGAEKLASEQDCEETRLNEFHFCSEPLYGYYNMLDPWVVTRHIELLTMAGMDFICFDVTNTIVYTDVAKLVLETLQKYQNQGFKVPKAMFYTNTDAGSTARKVYNDFYRTDKYDDVWFSPNGKPMFVCITEDNRGASDQLIYNPAYDDFFPEEFADRFDLHESQWPNGKVDHENALPWMSWAYPQKIHPNLKAMSVSIAQHDPWVVNFSAKRPHSNRGYNHVTKKIEENFAAGANFESQWKSVFDYEAKGTRAEMILQRSWNEWMAIKTFDGNETVFCDLYNEEYSCDAEMSKGACGDNFFMQMTRNMRKYKFSDAQHYEYQMMTVDTTDKTLAQWKNVRAHYRDFSGDALARNFKDAVNKGTYKDASNRNDITDVKAVHNATDLFVYVKTAQPITEYEEGDKGWMNLLIGTDAAEQSFEGYDFVINRNPRADGKTSIEKSTGGYNWESAGDAQIFMYDDGDVLVYKIPLAALNLTADNCHIRFKVTDNVTEPDNIMDYYISGDCAPIGRMSYAYGY